MQIHLNPQKWHQHHKLTSIRLLLGSSDTKIGNK